MARGTTPALLLGPALWGPQEKHSGVRVLGPALAVAPRLQGREETGEGCLSPPLSPCPDTSRPSPPLSLNTHYRSSLHVLSRASSEG